MKKTFEMKINEKEKRLLELIKTMEFGQMNIKIQNSKPIRVEECVRSIKI